MPLSQKQVQGHMAPRANHRCRAALQAWGVGNCLPQSSPAPPQLQASPWVSKPEAAPAWGAVPPGSSSSQHPLLRRGKTAFCTATTHFTELWGRRQDVPWHRAGDRGRGIMEEELRHCLLPLHRAPLGSAKQESCERGKRAIHKARGQDI